MTKVRLADIAAYAHVSEATVSRVLNNKPLVSADTRQSVLTALDVLGYDRPISLRSLRTGLVGLIVPELDNPIFPAYAQVIETALAAQGYTVVLCTQTPGGIHEDEYTRMLLDRGAAGIVFISGQHADLTASPRRYQRLQDAGLPMVLVNGFTAALHNIPFVSDDDVAAMAMAVEHLLSLGHVRIGLAVGQDRYVPTRRKVTGYLRALVGHEGVGAEPLVESTVFTFEGGAEAGTRLLARGATAIICGSDLMALGAIDAVRDAGLSAPEDISVIGYDDSFLMAHTSPPLTTLRQDVRAVGAAAVHALLAQIRGQAVPDGELLFRPTLIVRGTTGPLKS